MYCMNCFFFDNVLCLLSYEHVRLSCVFYSKLTYLLAYLLTYPNRNSNVNFLPFCAQSIQLSPHEIHILHMMSNFKVVSDFPCLERR